MTNRGRVLTSLFEEIEFLEQVDSTNEYLRRYVAGQIGRAVWAAEQTAGKGRHGRVWYSPRGQGLYASYLLFPDWEPSRAVVLNQVATLSVVESIRSIPGLADLPLAIKLPNDVLIGRSKVAGVLVELSTLPDRIKWAIIGIGVNLLQQEFPGAERFQLPPTSLRMQGAGGVQPGQFFEILTKKLEQLLRQLEQGDSGRLEASFQETLLGDL